MVMKKNIMAKNLTQSILRSFGRYLAIVLIIALGSALFIGLLMTQADMVLTGQVFTDAQNMFDLRFLSSYGWTDDQIEDMQELEGLTGLEASMYQDAIVRLGNETDDAVFRFYSIPERINQVSLRGGRMPQSPDECLADGHHYDDGILGTQVTLTDTNEELAFDSLAYDTYTIVGYVATPLYMDQNRGTTTVGSGSIESYFYIPAEGFSAEYYTEVNVTIPGDFAVYTDHYNGTMDDMTALLEPQVQQIADRWFQEILDEAEAEYADGYQQYLDGLAELEQGRIDAEKELADAYEQLMDAEREIADNEALLDDGEKQIADGKKELQKSEKELADGKKELEQAKKDAYAELNDGKAELDQNAAQVEDGLAQLNDGLTQLEDGLAQVEDGITQLEENLPQLEDGIAQLEVNLPQIEAGMAQLEGALPQLESGAAQLESLVQMLTPMTRGVAQILGGLTELPEGGEGNAAALLQAADMLHNVAEQLRMGLGAMAGADADASAAAGLERLLTRYYEMEGLIRQTAAQLAEDSAQLEALRVEIGILLAEQDAILAQYAAWLEELQAMHAAYSAQLVELQAMYAEYSAQLVELKAMYAEYSAQLAELYTTREDLLAQRAELLETRKTLEDARQAIDDGYAEWEKGKAQADKEFAKAERDIKNGEKQIKDGWSTLNSEEKKLNDGRRQLEEGKAELADGWIEYEEGKLEAEQTIADAEAELADAAVELADARKEIDDLEAPETYVLDRNTNVGYATLESNAEIVKGVSRILPAFFLLIAALVCITTMSRMVGEERTQIGTLKALGFSSPAIMSKYLVYAGTGGILGCGLGVLAGSTIIPQVIWDAYGSMLYITPDIEIRFNWVIGAAVTLAYTAVVLAVTWYCCHSTLKEVPAELIRPKAPTSGKKILLEYLLLWEKLSFLNKVALRNIFRYRQRFLMMLIGIGGCTALLVTGFGLRDSISNIVDYQYENISQYDLEVYFDGGRTAEDMAAFDIDGVDDVLFYHQESMEVDFHDKVREVTLLGAGSEISDFIDMRYDGELVAQPGPGEALLSVGVCDNMGVTIGDTVILRNADMQELRVTVSGIYENYVQNFAVVAPETMTAQWGGEPELQMALVKAEDPQSVSTRIANMDGVMTVLLSRDNADAVSQMMGALDSVMWLIVLAAGLLAVVVLYNLINININERIREIATIKVLGFHSNETASYVFKENMVLSVIGSIAGLGLGKLLLEFVLLQVKVDAVWFQSKITFFSLAISVALTLLATLIVQFIFTFKIERINMAEALKSVE